MLPRPILALILLGALVLAGCATPEPVPTGPGPTTPGGTGATNATQPNGTAPRNDTTGNGTGPGNDTTPAANEIQVLDNVYQPNQTTVAEGESLTFTNTGQALHSVTIQKDSGEPVVDSDIDPGETVTVDFPESGTYLLRCTYHSADYRTGQTGVITVT